MCNGKELTATNYPKSFIEDGDLDEVRRKGSHKSNLIMSLDRMSKEEKKKAGADIIDCEIFLAENELAKGTDFGNSCATDHLDSALNTADSCKLKYSPAIKNDLLRKAWDARDPWILVGTTRKEAWKKRNAELEGKDKDKEKRALAKSS